MQVEYISSTMSMYFESKMVSPFLAFLVIVSLSLTHATQQGFTTDLIHRDSPLSPLYNPSLNQYGRLRNSIHRSVSRINYLIPSSLSSTNDIQSQVKSSKGEYLMEVSFGTPPVSQYGIVDTGSDLIWVQCQPCLQCYKQNIPIFDPQKSSTYKVESCDSEACQALDYTQSSCSKKNTCSYRYAYGDQSHTSGDMAIDTLTFQSNNHNVHGNSPSYKVAFGCGHANAGTFMNEGSGLIGLGGGPLSLVSQLGSTIGGKFSYCLVPFAQKGNFTSKINFGTSGEVTGRGVVSTPIVKGETPTFYSLTLEGISVAEKRIPFSKSSSTNDVSENEGNIFIDSGTTLTLLPDAMFSDLFSALEGAIKGKQVDDPSGILKLCYETTNAGADLNIPTVTAHFTGADLELKPMNTFIQVADDVVCLAMVPAEGDFGAIFGNVAQMDFLIGYDVEEGKVSFKPMDCTKGM